MVQCRVVAYDVAEAQAAAEVAQAAEAEGGKTNKPRGGGPCGAVYFDTRNKYDDGPIEQHRGCC
jgi:hypothetical protein